MTQRIEVERPNWNHFFLLQAILWSKRSPDAQTQCGCVIIGKDNNILSAGYNGFIRGVNTDSLPNTRPYKYPFFLHSELNAILNAVRNGISLLGAKIYISGKPCIQCLQTIFQSGITHIYFTTYSEPKMVDSEIDKYKQLVTLMRSGHNFDITLIPLEDIQWIDVQNEKKSIRLN